MKFEDLLEAVGDLPLFRSSLLLAGDRDPVDVRRQLARWKTSGRVLKLRRNVYVLGAPWRKIQPHAFLIANELQRPSYVSLESALAHYAMIPEAVPVTTSVTTGRPVTLDTPLGRYRYRHVRRAAFFGYARVGVFRDQEALLADPAKALLDLIYLTPGGEAVEYLEALRLEGLEAIPTRQLRDHARRWAKDKIARAVEIMLRMRESVPEMEPRP